MGVIEWSVVAVFLSIVMASGIYCKKYIKNAEDFLVAGRGCGKYLGATAGEASALGAISLIAVMQAVYVGGPAAIWSTFFGIIMWLIIALSGWGIYRLRETRVMTLNELLEKRYSKKLRIFCGFLCFISGILNMGIFPIVEGRFIVYFCRLPLTTNLGFMHVSTIALVTAVLVGVSLLLAFKGGQVGLIITDFLQWTVITFMFVAVGWATYAAVNWDDVGKAIMTTENPKVLLDPFLPTTANSFGLLYCMMFAFRAFYNVLSWAPNSSRSQSATEAREAKLMWILSYIRQASNIGLLFAALACFAVAKLPEFGELAARIAGDVEKINNPFVRTEMIVPIFLAFIMSPIVKGLFVAGMIAASISTLDTYFLSWAGIFVQDVVAPIKKIELTADNRLRMLRWAVVGVAAFVYVFSLVWEPTDYIWMYFAITGTIYTGGAGAIILGALYWRKATTTGAWWAMITGSTLAISGIVLRKIFVGELWWPHWLDGMALSVAASVIAITVFITASMLSGTTPYDIDSLLHRTVGGEKVQISKKAQNKFRLETVVGAITFMIVITIAVAFWYNRTHDVTPQSWIKFWKWYTFVVYGYSIPVAIWFFIGSVRDLKVMFANLQKKHSQLNEGAKV